MRRTFGVTAVAISCWAATFVAQTAGERLPKADQLFELRQAVTRSSPTLIQAAVATAFNGPEAESLLRATIRSQPHSDAADEAYHLLCQIQERSGQYARFTATYREWAAAFPNSPGVRDEEGNLRKYRGRPNQTNTRRRPSTLRHDSQSYSVPVSINGMTDDFLIDTGAWQSVLSLRKAQKLGLKIGTDTVTVSDASGTGVPARTAVAREVIVGAMRFRDVSFEVLGGPFEDVDAGILGMPMQLSLGRIEWSTDGTIRIGSDADRSAGRPNLLFFRHRLLVQTEVLGKTALGVVDTGAEGTDLNANLADLLPESLTRDVKRRKQEITGAGGTQTFDAFDVPELVFSLGQGKASLRPAVVTLQRMPLMGGECCIGNVGLDLLTQGQGFSIDFSTMTLQLK